MRFLYVMMLTCSIFLTASAEVFTMTPTHIHLRGTCDDKNCLYLVVKLDSTHEKTEIPELKEKMLKDLGSSAHQKRLLEDLRGNGDPFKLGCGSGSGKKKKSKVKTPLSNKKKEKKVKKKVNTKNNIKKKTKVKTPIASKGFLNRYKGKGLDKPRFVSMLPDSRSGHNRRLGFFSALMCSGSFMMMQAGAF